MSVCFANGSSESAFYSSCHEDKVFSHFLFVSNSQSQTSVPYKKKKEDCDNLLSPGVWQLSGTCEGAFFKVDECGVRTKRSFFNLNEKLFSTNKTTIKDLLACQANNEKFQKVVEKPKKISEKDAEKEKKRIEGICKSLKYSDDFGEIG